MATLKYNAANDRMMIGNVALHNGYPVTVVLRNGGRFETRIESDRDGWYLVDWPQDGMRGHAIAGIKVEPLLNGPNEHGLAHSANLWRVLCYSPLPRAKAPQALSSHRPKTAGTLRCHSQASGNACWETLTSSEKLSTGNIKPSTFKLFVCNLTL